MILNIRGNRSRTCECIYQEQSERGHEAFFGELPRSSVLLLIHLLEAAEVNVQDAGVHHAEAAQHKNITFTPKDREKHHQSYYYYYYYDTINRYLL